MCLSSLLLLFISCKMFLTVYVLVFISTVVYGFIDHNSITLGVIGNGEPCIKEEVLQVLEFNVSVVWNYIDIREVYQIYRAIHIFDGREDIDIIILFDYDPLLLAMPLLLQTKEKQLVKWGDNVQTTVPSQTDETSEMNLNDICGDEIVPSLHFDDPSCIIDLNTSSIGTTLPNDSITVTAPKAVTTLVEILEWKTVFIFHENATEREAANLSMRLSDSGVLFVIYNIDIIQDFPNVLHKIYNSTVHIRSEINIIVLCRFLCTRRILRTANTFDTKYTQDKTLLKQFTRWLVAVYGHSMGVSHALQACADDLDNVVIIGIPEISGAGKEDVPRLIDEMIKDMIRKQIMEPDKDIKLRTYFLQELSQKAASWSQSSKCKGYNIDTLLWTDNKSRSFSSVGYVDLSGNVLITNIIFPNTKHGYNMRTFTVSTLPYRPFIEKTVLNGTVKYQGLCIDLLDELASTLNFTYIITEPADGNWGIMENGTYNGLIGQLQKEEVDMVAAPIINTPERELISDFAYPFYHEYTAVVIKKPDDKATKWRTLVDPFKWQVLISIGIALLTVTVIVYLLEKYNPYYDTPAHAEERRTNGGLNHLHNAFWYMYGALLCQGGIHLPDSIAGRSFISCWWIFCIIIVGIYSGNLIAFLTVSKEKAPFNTLEEMVEMKGTYKWGTLGGTMYETVFKTSSVPIFKKVGEGLKEFSKTDPSIMDKDPNVHISRVIKETNYAWIGDKTFIEISMANECGLMKMKEEFLPVNYAFAFPNNSPQTQIFSNQMMKITEGGLVQIWKRKWWPKANFCRSETVTEAKPISVVDVQSAFFVCVVGIFFGTLAFICELTIVHFKKCISNYRNKSKFETGDINNT